MSYQRFDAQRCSIRPNATPVGVGLLAGAIARLCLCVVGGRVCAIDSHTSRLYLRYALRRCIALLVRYVALCGCICVVNRAALICGLLGLACLRLIVTCLRLIVICLLNCLLLSKAPVRQPLIALQGPSPSQGHAYAYAGAGLVDVSDSAGTHPSGSREHRQHRSRRHRPWKSAAATWWC